MRKMLAVPSLAVPERRGGAALPRDLGGPAFEEAWQAHTFAIVMALYRDGRYSWAEWDDYLGYAIQAPGHFTGSEGDDAAASAAANEDETARPNYSRWIAACEADGARFYDLWRAAAEHLLSAKGIVGAEELEERVRALAAAEGRAPRFEAGSRVLVHDIDRVGHTHLPRYLRGKTGLVESDRGLFVFPEADHHGEAETLQHVYTVRFRARDVWGPEASERDSMHFNLWDYNLAPA